MKTAAYRRYKEKLQLKKRYSFLNLTHQAPQLLYDRSNVRHQQGGGQRRGEPECGHRRTKQAEEQPFGPSAAAAIADVRVAVARAAAIAGLLGQGNDRLPPTKQLNKNCF